MARTTTPAGPAVGVGRVESAVGTVVLRVLGVALGLAAGVAVVAPRYPNIAFDQVVIVLGLLLSLLAAMLLHWASRSTLLRAVERWAWAVAVAVSALAGWRAVWLARQVRSEHTWDAGVVSRFSEQLMTTGVLPPGAEGYFSRWSNNIPLLGVMNLCGELAPTWGTDMFGVFLWLNGACLAAVLLLVFVLVTMLRGRLAGLAAQALVIVLVGASPWMAVPYTDLLVMPAVLSGAVLAVGALGARRWWARAVLAAGAASALAVGYVLKSTPASSLAALGVVALVLVLRRPSARFLAGAAAVVAGAAVVAAGTVALATDAAYAAARVDRAQLHLERTPPAAWWVAMGLISYRASNGLYTYGGYNGQMVRDSRGLGGEQLDAWSTQRLHDQLRAMGAGGVARLEANKMVFNWGDGMFFAWGEGSDEKPTLLMDRGSTARAVQSWQHVSGEHYVTRASLVTGLWLFVVLSASLGLLSAPYRRQILALALMVAGIALFTLLFQGRSRYLLSYVPIVVVLATALDPARPFTALWARWRPDLADAAEEGEPSVLSGVRAERSQGRSTCEGGSPFVRMTNTSAKCEHAARLTPWHWTLRRRSAPRSP